MADNVTLPGTGEIVATDEIAGGVKVQRVKVTHGGDGTATDVSTGSPLPVVQTGALTVGVSSLPSLDGTEVAVTDLPELPAGDNLIGQVDVNEFPASSRSTDTVGSTTDVASVADGLSAATVKFATISASASGYSTLVAAVTGKKIRVLSYALVAAAAVTAQFASASTAKSGAMALGANGGVSAQAPQGLLETASGEALRINLGGAVAVAGHLSYVEL